MFIEREVMWNVRRTGGFGIRRSSVLGLPGRVTLGE
jgi:hypothetical protein